MTKNAILGAWGRVLRGRKPLLSIEITKECPLRCPGCYAYEPEHLGDTPLRQLSDYRGSQLVDAVLGLVRRHRPLHISIVGGEPLVRYRELSILLPKLDRMKIEVQLVTSAVRPLPLEWRSIGCLHLVVSVDGLPPEHDRRRAPATYERILQNIGGHQVIVHCTITRQQLARDGYLDEFTQFWSARPEARKIWFSMFTPQEGQDSMERLAPEDRIRATKEIGVLTTRYPKIDVSPHTLEGFLRPPATPAECIFAQSTLCVSADLATKITPCQFGGRPVCSECGCIASAGLAAIGRYKIGGILPLASIFSVSQAVGKKLAGIGT
ncbi:MAG TPA: radical SAM protein [Bryobacteraceae bacterium]